jgi:hypothetical protein
MGHPLPPNRLVNAHYTLSKSGPLQHQHKTPCARLSSANLFACGFDLGGFSTEALVERVGVVPRHMELIFDVLYHNSSIVKNWYMAICY